MTKVVDAREWLKTQQRDRRLEHEERIYGPREPMPPKAWPTDLVKLTAACKAALRAAKEKSGLQGHDIAIECDCLVSHVHAAMAVGDSYGARRRIPQKAAEALCRLFHVKMEIE